MDQIVIKESSWSDVVSRVPQGRVSLFIIFINDLPEIIHLGKNNPKRKYYMKDVTSNEFIMLDRTDSERDLGIIITSNG